MPIALLLPILFEAEAKTNSPDLTRYVLVCVAMLGLVLLLAYGFRKLLMGNMKRRAAARSLQVVDMLPMGGKQRLVVVRCYDRHFLIGLGDKELSSIAELEAGSDELPSSSVLSAPVDTEKIDRRGFAGALESVMGKWKQPRQSPAPQKVQPQERSVPAPVASAPSIKRPAAPASPASASPARPVAKRADWNREQGILG